MDSPIDWGIYGYHDKFDNLETGPYEEDHENNLNKKDTTNDSDEIESPMEARGHNDLQNRQLFTETVVGSESLHQTLMQWRCFMTLLTLQKNPDELTRDDMIYKDFSTAEDAERFFHIYAKLRGFSVRKGHKRRRVTGEISMREWLCSREGSRRKSALERMDRVREAQAITRVGCRVSFRVVQEKSTNSWVVKEFITEHSHPLAQPFHIKFLRSNRNVTGGALQTAISMRGSGIRTCHIMSFMAEQAGGYDKVPFQPKDLYNRITMYEQIQLSDCDAAKAMGYLQHKADHDVKFYAKFSYNEYRRLQNVVWADSRCQSDYSHFGHALAFDTTYKTNKYKKPLLIFVGINHHYKTTIFGFAILIDETKETYKWVIESFLECMGGVLPETVVTDGDLAIRAAIVELMPMTKHRLCTWHIGENALKNVKDPGFRTRLNRLMFRRFTDEKFVKEWNDLIEDFGLQNNTWASDLFERREYWAETFMGGFFFGGNTTTQRCEGMNHFMKTKVNKKMKLSQFVRRVDLALSWLRHGESRDDFECANTEPLIGITNMQDTERQAAKIYTRDIFFLVRNEIKREGKYLLKSNTKEDGIVTTKFTKYQQEHSTRTVTYNEAADTFECECETFPSKGIPCRHIFAAMKSMHKKAIPESLILRRWTMQAKEGTYSHQAYTPRCKYTCSEESARFGHINGKAAELAYYSSKHEELFHMGNKIIEQGLMALRTAWEGYMEKNKKMSAEPKPEVDVRNPVFSKTKGTSPTKGLGRKGVRKCSICNKRGHNKTTCLRREINRFKSPEKSISCENLYNSAIDLEGDTELWSDSEARTRVSAESPTKLDRFSKPNRSVHEKRNKIWETDEDATLNELYEGSGEGEDNDIMNDVDYDDFWGTPFGN